MWVCCKRASDRCSRPVLGPSFKTTNRSAREGWVAKKPGPSSHGPALRAHGTLQAFGRAPENAAPSVEAPTDYGTPRAPAPVAATAGTEQTNPPNILPGHAPGEGGSLRRAVQAPSRLDLPGVGGARDTPRPAAAPLPATVGPSPRRDARSEDQHH